MRALRHAEKWRLGQPLARDVIGYHVATAVVVQCRAPTAGLRDVRVTVGVPSIAAGTCNSSAGASAHLRFPGIAFAWPAGLSESFFARFGCRADAPGWRRLLGARMAASVSPVLPDFGCQLAGGEFRAAPPKGLTRIK